MFYIFERNLLCSSSLHLFAEKYSKDRICFIKMCFIPVMQSLIFFLYMMHYQSKILICNN